MCTEQYAMNRKYSSNDAAAWVTSLHRDHGIGFPFAWQMSSIQKISYNVLCKMSDILIVKHAWHISPILFMYMRFR